jgi:hypothetical protein
MVDSNIHSTIGAPPQDMQTQLEQSMQRSVTLVYWHEVGLINFCSQAYHMKIVHFRLIFNPSDFI